MRHQQAIIFNGLNHTRSFFFFYCMSEAGQTSAKIPMKNKIMAPSPSSTSSDSSPVFPQYNCCRQQTSHYHQSNQVVGDRLKLNRTANWFTLPSFATRSTKRTLQETQTSNNMKISWTAPPSRSPPTSTSMTTTNDKNRVESKGISCATKGYCVWCGKADASRMCPRCGITSYCSKECYR